MDSPVPAGRSCGYRVETARTKVNGIMFPNIPVTLPHIKAGRLRALAVSTAKRSALFPELPTILESGLPGFEVLQWSGLLAPAGTPGAIVGKYQREIATALNLPDVRQKLV